MPRSRRASGWSCGPGISLWQVPVGSNVYQGDDRHDYDDEHDPNSSFAGRRQPVHTEAGRFGVPRGPGEVPRPSDFILRVSRCDELAGSTAPVGRQRELLTIGRMSSMVNLHEPLPLFEGEDSPGPGPVPHPALEAPPTGRTSPRAGPHSFERAQLGGVASA